MKITITLRALITIFISLLFLPFFYFYFISSTQLFFLANPSLMYILITISSLCLAFCADIGFRHPIRQETKNKIFSTAVTLVVLYALLLFILTITRFNAYISQAVDVFFFHQVIWQFAEFKIPYIWLLSQPLYPQWSQHFSPILIFLAPIYWIIPNAVMLMVTQALAAITGAIPIYLIVKRHLKSRSIGIALSFAYLAFGGLQYGFDYGFHEILFFPVLFLWSYYFYLKKNVRLYLLFILLSLFVKEEVAFIVIFWSIYLFIVKKDLKIAGITGILGIAWYIICFNIVFPYFSHGGFGYWGQYQTKGGTGLFGIILAAFSNPFQFLLTLITPIDKIKMMLETFGQFAFLFLLFPPSLIIIFPSLMEKLLSSDVVMSSGAHYSAAITAVVVVATIEALQRIYKYTFVNKFIHNKNAFFAVLIFYMAYSSAVFYGYVGFSPILLFQKNVFEQGLSADNSMLLNQILSNLNNLPKDTTVSSQAQILPHIPFYYKNLSTWPGMSGTEDLVILDTQIYPVGASITEDEANFSNELIRLSKNKDYQLIVRQSDIYVFKKKSSNFSTH